MLEERGAAAAANVEYAYVLSQQGADELSSAWVRPTLIAKLRRGAAVVGVLRLEYGPEVILIEFHSAILTDVATPFLIPAVGIASSARSRQAVQIR